jgi:uncharacterized protein YacL
MFIQYIIRVFLGTFLGVAGYYLSNTYLPHITVVVIPNFYQFMTTLTCAVYGFYALPFAFITYQQMLVGWLFNFVRSIIGDTLQDFYLRLSEEVSVNQENKKRLREQKEKKIETTSTLMILDTSAIIDGRIGEIIKTGFLTGTLIIPQFVIQELQYIADSADELKRNRGRKGLELLNEFKKLKTQKDKIGIKIVTTDYDKVKKVDDKLIKLAKALKAAIVTTDFNLNKAAAFQSIKILNVNTLTNAVKAVTLPGETLDIKIIQEGKEKNQGVGYLDDGTMVVVENAQGMLGQLVKVEVSRVLQTAAGKMIFTQVQN